MEEGKAPGLSWKRVEDTLSVAPPFPRALQGSGGNTSGRWTNGRLVQAPRAVCAVSALDATKTARLSFDHGHHPNHAKTQRPPDRRGSGQDRDQIGRASCRERGERQVRDGVRKKEK